MRPLCHVLLDLLLLVLLCSVAGGEAAGQGTAAIYASPQPADGSLSDSSKAPYPLPTPHAYLPHQYISSIKDYVGCTNRRLLLLDDYQPQLPVVSWA